MVDNAAMARPDDNSPRLLTIAVTSRALFDLEESHALYESEGFTLAGGRICEDIEKSREHGFALAL